jgi:hypothetical protein
VDEGRDRRRQLAHGSEERRREVASLPVHAHLRNGACFIFSASGPGCHDVRRRECAQPSIPCRFSAACDEAVRLQVLGRIDGRITSASALAGRGALDSPADPSMKFPRNSRSSGKRPTVRLPVAGPYPRPTFSTGAAETRRLRRRGGRCARSWPWWEACVTGRGRRHWLGPGTTTSVGPGRSTSSTRNARGDDSRTK